MSFSCRRKAEQVFCDLLTLSVPDLHFYPSKGDAEDAPIQPPYAVVTFTDGEKPFSDEDTYTLPGTLVIVTHIGATRGEAHDALVRSVEDAVDGIKRGFYATRQFVLHGLNREPSTAITDDEATSHGDVIELEVSCSG